MIKENELLHDKKILADAERVWGRAGEAGRRRLERRVKGLIENCQIGVGKKVLEIGCGTGTLTSELAKTGATIVATDIFPDFLDIAKNKIGNNQNVVFQVVDGETLEGFAESSFDAVVGFSILHHLDIDKVLPSIYFVLKPNGFMAFSEPNMLNPQIALERNIPFFRKLMNNSPDETAFFRWSLFKKIHENGFKKTIVAPFDFLHPAIPDFLASIIDNFGLVLEKIPFIKEIGGSLFIVAKK